MGQYILDTLRHTLSDFFQVLMGFLPRLFATLIIIALGWSIALVLKLLMRRVLTWVRFNRLFENTNLKPVLARAALPPPDELLCRLTFWAVGIAFTFLGGSVLGVVALQEEISRFVVFLPQI